MEDAICLCSKWMHKQQSEACRLWNLIFCLSRGWALFRDEKVVSSCLQICYITLSPRWFCILVNWLQILIYMCSNKAVMIQYTKTTILFFICDAIYIQNVLSWCTSLYHASLKCPDRITDNNISILYSAVAI